MGYSEPSYQPIVPWGSWGDGGNNGWIPDDGHYFQVYGPKPTTSATDSASEALKKAIDDFDKLPQKWKDVRRYSFVMNDRSQGIPAPIASALQTLEKEKQLISARGFPTKDLMELFMGLNLDKRQDIVGAFIPPTHATECVDRSVKIGDGYQATSSPVITGDNVKVDIRTGSPGSRCGRFEPAIELLRLGTVRVESLITDRFPIASAAQAFARVAEKGVLKVLLDQ